MDRLDSRPPVKEGGDARIVIDIGLMLAEAIRRIFYILIIGICVVSSRVIHCVDAFCSSTILKIENERRQILQAVYTRQTNGLVMYKTDPQKSRGNHQSKLMIIDHETSLSFMHCIE